MKMGNCYAATEALYNILGGKDSGWKVMRIADKDLGQLKDVQHSSHWYLQHKDTEIILDVTVKQFNGKKPDYSLGVHASFYPTKAGMSKRASTLVDVITYREF